ncbi:hypothetical protein JCM6882_003083 [Rhodosporidiobolus microsporus]
MANDGRSSASTLRNAEEAPHRRVDLEKAQHDEDDLREQDRPHRETETPPSRGEREPEDEPPLETGGPLPPSSSAATPPPSLFKSANPLLETCSFLTFATIWGVLARLGLIWVGGFGEREVFALIWAQMVGCVVMGLVTERKKGLERVFPPLFPMSGTGFCGSLTTWSSMSLDTFNAFANLDQPAGTSRFSGFVSGMAVTLITLAGSMTALQFGVHLSSFLPRVRLPHQPLRGQVPVTTLALLSGPLFWLGALFLLIFGPSSWRSRATFAIVLGPFGTLLRYLFSRTLNPLRPSLPTGTLLANSLAVLVLGVVVLLARHPRSELGCAALKGVQDGFCGSLSTISTLAVELRGLKRAQSYRYFGVSWVVAQLLLVAVLGSWVWSDDRGAVCWAR